MTADRIIELQIIGFLALLLIALALHVYRLARSLWGQPQEGRERKAPPSTPIRGAALPGAGAALTSPPSSLAATIQELRRNDPDGRYRFPLGWSSVRGQAAVSQASLVGDVNHTLLTAQSDGGKDNWAIGVLLCLAALHSPDELQVCIIDGKGLDFAGWEGLPYTWRLALSPKEIAPTMQAITSERERRGNILRAAGVSKWDTYQGGDLPLLVVYVSELSLLQDATSKSDLEGWLNSELAAGRSFGIRFIVATQTASNFGTRWRSQIALYVAGFQPSQSQDEPNTGLRAAEIQRAGAVPPSELPAPPTGAGVFCCVYGRDAVNVRAPLLNDTERKKWVEALQGVTTASRRSNAGEALPANVGSSQNDTPGKHGSTEALIISEDERQRIREAAQTETSRGKVCQRVYGTRGGRAYDKVRQVCDEEGLLVAEPVAAA